MNLGRKGFGSCSKVSADTANPCGYFRLKYIPIKSSISVNGHNLRRVVGSDIQPYRSASKAEGEVVMLTRDSDFGKITEVLREVCRRTRFSSNRFHLAVVALSSIVQLYQIQAEGKGDTLNSVEQRTAMCVCRVP